MISLVYGPGGPLRRLGNELVPLGATGIVGLTVLPFVSPIFAGVFAFGVWLALSGLLIVVRARPLMRRVYRLAVLLHIGFWGAVGVSESALEPAGPVSEPRVHDWGRGTTVRAGVGAMPFELPAGTPLAGWGTRPRRVNLPAFAGMGPLGRMTQFVMGRRDENGLARWPIFQSSRRPNRLLGAHALVLVPEEAPNAAPVAFVRVDLATGDALLTQAILGRVARLGYRAETVTVSSTHTHSGPGAYSRQPLSEVVGTGHFDQRVFDAVVDAAVKAIETAHLTATPANVALLRSRDHDDGAAVLARNRRRDPGDIDDRVYGIAVYDRQSRLQTLLLNYAVHPTVYKRQHAEYDGDLALALEVGVGARLRATVLFVNGAVGDVSPIHTGHTDATERLAELARRFADVVARDVEACRPLPLLRMRCADVERDLGTPHAVITSGERASFLDGPGRGLLSEDGWVENALALPVNFALWCTTCTEMRVGFTFDGSFGTVVNLYDHVTERRSRFGAMTFALSSFDGDTEEAFAALWLPGEATQALGKAWREAATGLGYADTLIFGLTNGVCAYLTTSEEYAQETYESRVTLYGADAGEVVGEALLTALSAARVPR